MTNTKWSHRNLLKRIGITVGGTFFPFSLWGRNETGEPLILPNNAHHKKLTKPVTAVVIGAGARGNVYGDYALEYPDQLQIVGVAEPVDIRRSRFSDKHRIPEERRFLNWHDVFNQPKFADAIIIATSDHLHYEPCMAALRMGYDILLEKPIAPTEAECRDILQLSRSSGRIVAVCHVLRYAPYFVKLRELIKSGAIGEVISLQHMEPIEHTHMAHSYVRGNWHDSTKSTPIVLAKSCHDFDIIKWLIGKKSRQIQAFGGLRWFTKENAPKGSKARCTDGCEIESSCPYSALKLYYRRRERTYVFDLPEKKKLQGEAILNYLENTDYGRCVYRMDNDQCDHYTSNILFEGGVTASFTMDAFTPYGGRRTRIMGSMGFIEGDMRQLVIHDFRTDKVKRYETTVEEVEHYQNEGHGGGDWRMVADWVQAVAQNDPGLLSSTIDASIESHLMCFKAEESRSMVKVMAIEMEGGV